MRNGGTMNAEAPTALESAISQHSPWHSPVPYLFGGLAAMLGLISFALLILACSYWRLYGFIENGDDGERDLENGDEKGSDGIKVSSVFEEKIVVIMAGDNKPSFIATPISCRASSLGDNNKKNNCDDEKSDKNETPKEEMDHQEHLQQQHQHQEVAEQNRETNQSLNHQTQNQNQ